MMVAIEAPAANPAPSPPAAAQCVVRSALALLAALWVAVLLTSSAFAQDRRVALVVGADRYRHIPALNNATNDARALARRLGELGFEVVGPVMDPTREQFLAALDQFDRRLNGAEAGLFFFAGHAVEIEGRNILLPVDAPAATSRRLVEASGVMVADVLNEMQARTPRVIAILDSCRDNPLPRDATRGGAPVVGSAGGLSTRGLEPIGGSGRGGRFVVFAAEPGATALDRLPNDPPNANGLFTRHLLSALDTPGRPLTAVMTEVRDRVAASARAAGREQRPHLDDRMEGSGEFMLARGVIPPPSPQPAPPAPAPAALELAFWQSIQGSQRVEEFEAYLRQFPQGTFAGLARARIVALRAPASPAPQPQPAVGVWPQGSGYPVPVGQAFRDCPECPEMVVIPSGTFTMGSPAGEQGRLQSEGPQRQVTVRAPLAVGRHAVTVGQYRAFAQATGRGDGGSCRMWSTWENRQGLGWRNPGFGQGDEHPVVCVIWEDAQAYARWLSQRTGHRYRLLTEAEWEYAARAGTTTRWWWGENEAQQCRHANGADHTARAQVSVASGWAVAPCTDGFAHTAPVGRFLANRFGLHDMGGNAWQWVEDCYRDSYAGAPSDASQAVTTGDCASRVLRGGSWYGSPRDLRSANRGWSSPGNRDNYNGIRVARTPGG